MDKSEEELAWEQENEVVIDYVQQSDAEEAKEFLYENFYKDEPLFKSFKILNINGWFDRYMLKEVDKFLIHQPIGNPYALFLTMGRATYYLNLLCC